MALEGKLVFCKGIDHEKVIRFIFLSSIWDSDKVLLCCYLKHNTLKCLYSPLINILTKRMSPFILFLSNLIKWQIHILYTKYLDSLFTKVLSLNIDLIIS